MNNDQQVQLLLDNVEAKLKALQKPLPVYKTNCSLSIDSRNSVNLRTITDLKEIVNYTSMLLQKQYWHDESCKILNVQLPFEYSGNTFENWVSDLKLISESITFKQKEKELKTIKSKLEGLMSKDMKDSIELNALMKLLSEMK